MPTREISLVKVFVPSALVALLMLGLAVIATAYCGVDWSRLPWAYTKPALAVSFIFLLVAVFLNTASSGFRLASNPIGNALSFAMARSELLILPAVVAPIFLAGFTATKTAMAHVTGFHWDERFAIIDAAIFGADPWRLTHSLIGEPATSILGFFYTVVWGLTLAFSKGLVAIYGSRRFVGTFFLAMLMTWLVVGILFAYLFNSAGPVFAHLVDPVLGERFVPLVLQLNQSLPPDASVISTQEYLGSAIFTFDAVKGGGVSAMPSMHIAVAAIFIFAAKGTPWIWPAILFMVLTWIGSVHFGYHYAIDGIPSVIGAAICWRVARHYYYGSEPAPRLAPIPA